jgi:hypothetical protein
MRKLLIGTALVAMVFAVPAASLATAPPPKAQKCQPHAVAYIVSGTLVSGWLTANSDATYSGSLTVQVTKANN